MYATLCPRCAGVSRFLLGVDEDCLREVIELDHCAGRGAGRPGLPVIECMSTSSTGGGSRSKRRILVVDDNVDAAEALCLLLQMNGFEVHMASDGAQAIELAQAYRPDTILMDIAMPNMDGWEVARRIYALPGCERCRIVALTGYDQEGARERTREVGMLRHLVKPVDFDVLHELLLKLI